MPYILVRSILRFRQNFVEVLYITLHVNPPSADTCVRTEVTKVMDDFRAGMGSHPPKKSHPSWTVTWNIYHVLFERLNNKFDVILTVHRR